MCFYYSFPVTFVSCGKVFKGVSPDRLPKYNLSNECTAAICFCKNHSSFLSIHPQGPEEGGANGATALGTNRISIWRWTYNKRISIERHIWLGGGDIQSRGWPRTQVCAPLLPMTFFALPQETRIFPQETRICPQETRIFPQETRICPPPSEVCRLVSLLSVHF